jgi:hypothetical protein
MAPAQRLTAALLRGRLPAAFERWRVVVPPGFELPTTAAEWAGALVLIEQGAIEVDCHSGAFRRFVAGDLLALGWLPLKTIRNPTTEDAALIAVRRRGDVSTRRRFIRVRGVSGLG